MKTEKVDFDNPSRELDKIFEKVLKDNITEIPYEGAEVDKQGIKYDLLQALKDNHYSLLKHNKTS